MKKFEIDGLKLPSQLELVSQRIYFIRDVNMIDVYQIMSNVKLLQNSRAFLIITIMIENIQIMLTTLSYHTNHKIPIKPIITIPDELKQKCDLMRLVLEIDGRDDKDVFSLSFLFSLNLLKSDINLTNITISINKQDFIVYFYQLIHLSIIQHVKVM